MKFGVNAALAGVIVAGVWGTGALAQERTIANTISPAADMTNAEKRWEAIFNFETRYFTGSVSPSVPTGLGQTPIPDKTKQVFVPFGAQLNWRPTDDVKFSTLVRSAYLWSRQVSDVEAAEFHALTDTSISTQATYLGFNGFQPFLQIAVNIPTGQTLFTGNKSNNVKPDFDVTGVPSFGEGWNYGMTMGVQIPVSAQLMTSYGIGYTNRGSFKRDCDICNFNPSYDTLNPGDVVTANATAAWRGERTSVSVSASYSYETVTTMNGRNFFQAGDRFFLAAGIGYAWTEQLATRLTGSYSHTAKNKICGGCPPDVLVQEQFNTNSDVYTVNLSTSYRDGRSTYGPVVGFLYRDKNGYDSAEREYLSAKTKWTAGWVFNHALTQNTTITSRIEHMWIKEGERPFVTMPELDSRIWAVSLGGIFRY